MADVCVQRCLKRAGLCFLLSFFANLGNPINYAQAAAKGRQISVQAADRFAETVHPVIESIRRSGITSLRGVATALNNRGVRTARNEPVAGFEREESAASPKLRRLSGFNRRENDCPEHLVVVARRMVAHGLIWRKDGGRCSLTG